MTKRSHLYLLIFTSGFLFLADQILKYLARSNSDFTFYLLKPWIGWEFLANSGIAFGIHVPQYIIIPLTLLILVFALLYSVHIKQKSARFVIGLALIIAGAVSNLVDRVVFSSTIDYFRIITSVFNLADIMIVVGAVLVAMKGKNSKTRMKRFA